MPKHAKLSDGEKEKLLKEYNISVKELPKINIKDPAIQGMNLKVGDVVKITRKSETTRESVFYRGVIDG